MHPNTNSCIVSTQTSTNQPTKTATIKKSKQSNKLDSKHPHKANKHYAPSIYTNKLTNIKLANLHTQNPKSLNVQTYKYVINILHP